MEKRIWRAVKGLSIMAAGLALSFGAGAKAQTYYEEIIQSFEAQIEIQEDASVKVEERIGYDFGRLLRHGIYRDIPVKYDARGGNYNLRIDDVSVTDERGQRRTFELLKEGRNLWIKIGDADKEVTGQQVYVINYTVRRAINYFRDYDELYWNVTGNEWEVPIKEASVTVLLPKNANRENLRSECWVGPMGSEDPCLKAEIKAEVAAAGYSAPNPLPAGEGMTVAVGWNKGVVYEPTWRERIWATALDNWVVGVPIAALIIMFNWWRRYGRDPKGRGTIVPQYEPPPGLSPAETGTVVDESADNEDLAADLIDLAVKGYIRIVHKEERVLLFKATDWKLVKLKEPDGQISQPQQLMMAKLFRKKSEVEINDLKKKFHQEWKEISKAVYTSVVERGYFRQSPQTTKAWFIIGGIALAFAGFILGSAQGAISVVSFIVSGIVVALFGLVMPAKTSAGVLMYEYILGLKRYLSVAEKERLKFHNAPEKKPEHFDKLLPYAMALGVEKEWAKQFEGLDREPPNWYQGPAGTHFAAVALASDLGDFSSAAGSSLSSTASSGGSGFSGGGSGGGFGGGGGGSW